MKTFQIAATDPTLEAALHDRFGRLGSTKGGFGRLEELAVKIAAVQHCIQPKLMDPHIIVFAGDHGISEEGVSGSDEGTAREAVRRMLDREAPVQVLCRLRGIAWSVIDAGLKKSVEGEQLTAKYVRRATRNFIDGAAMTADEFEKAFDAGVQTVEELRVAGCNVLGVGCVGAGSTAAAAVWLHLLGGVPLETCVGAGCGLGSAGVRRKCHVLHEAVDGFKKSADTMDVMRRFGGYEMVMATGAVLQAAQEGMTILADGFVAGCVLLAASRIDPEVMRFAVCCGHSGEACHGALLAALGVEPLLALGLRSADGMGIASAYPLVEAAVALCGAK